MGVDPKKIAEWKAQRFDAAADALADGEPVRASILWGLHVAQEAVPALLSEREEMLAMLREVEWVPRPGPPALVCLFCGGYDRDWYVASDGEYQPATSGKAGHTSGCRLALAVREEG